MVRTAALSISKGPYRSNSGATIAAASKMPRNTAPGVRMGSVMATRRRLLIADPGVEEPIEHVGAQVDDDESHDADEDDRLGHQIVSREDRSPQRAPQSRDCENR